MRMLPKVWSPRVWKSSATSCLSATVVLVMATQAAAQAAGASVVVSAVRATREPAHLRVDVRGEGAIDPDLAHAKVDDGRLFLFLGGTRVRADNRSWELAGGLGSVEAHRHHGYVEIVVPLERNGCSGPVEIAAAEDGLTALVGCGGSGRAAAGAVPAVSSGSTPTQRAAAANAGDAGSVEQPGRPARAAHGARAEQVEQQAEQARIEGAGSDDLKDDDARTSGRARSEPSRVPVPSPSADATLVARAPAAPRSAAPVAAAGRATEEPTRAENPPERTREHDTLAALVALPATPPPIPAAATGLPSPSPSPSTSPAGSSASSPLSLATVAFAPPSASTSTSTSAALGTDGQKSSLLAPAGGLAVLAVAAYLLARRRKGAAVDRHIQILETASLGPKRTLIMARIGGETLLLGTSEAGITLLKSGGSGAEMFPSSQLPISLARQAGAAVAPTDQGPADPFAAAETFGEIDVPIVEALADIPEPRGEQPLATGNGRAGFRSIEGGLASLFGRSAGGRRSPADAFSDAFDDAPVVLAGASLPGGRDGRAVPRGSAGFDDILEDSIEDQELRQKLAAGLSARAR
jgi:hypothetical protein